MSSTSPTLITAADLLESEQAWLDQFNPSHCCYHNGDKTVVPVGEEKRIPEGMEAHSDWTKLPLIKEGQTEAGDGVDNTNGKSDDMSSSACTNNNNAGGALDMVSMITEVRQQVGTAKKLMTAIAVPVKQIATFMEQQREQEKKEDEKKKSEGEEEKRVGCEEGAEDVGGGGKKDPVVTDSNGSDNHDSPTEQMPPQLERAVRNREKALAEFEALLDGIVATTVRHRNSTHTASGEMKAETEQWCVLVCDVLSEVRVSVVDLSGGSSIGVVRRKEQFAEFTLMLNSHGRQLFKLQTDLLQQIKQRKK
eukprot:GHVS01105975.1.p1 GENE.GHVS01105975.1~~GHVS01105975.1.p1  ORF type:complete len:338 (+),score=92.90 GHVS01105975.1:95-1015(+)